MLVATWAMSLIELAIREDFKCIGMCIETFL